MTSPGSGAVAGPAWLRAAVADGLQRLIAIAPPGHPPAETILLTAAAWCEALLAMPVGWDESLDRGRLRRAFAALLIRVDRWPQPKHLIEAMPARAVADRLPRPQPSAEQRAIAAAYARAIAERLGGGR